MVFKCMIWAHGGLGSPTNRPEWRSKWRIRRRGGSEAYFRSKIVDVVGGSDSAIESSEALFR